MDSSFELKGKGLTWANSSPPGYTGIYTRNEPHRVYLSAFYFCSYTMTSVGYGDIGPKIPGFIGEFDCSVKSRRHLRKNDMRLRNLFERSVCTVIILAVPCPLQPPTTHS